jgi:putative CocE/NonD family hydrolase
MWARDALVWFKNLDNPQKLVIGPWSHSQRFGCNLAAEHVRWYDYWLKGIASGIMGSAPIYYYTMKAPEGKEWCAAWQWPLPNQQLINYYFHGGPSGSVHSVNDGLLMAHPPRSVAGQDDYTVNYTTTSGRATRWTNGYGGEFNYTDMTLNDEKGLTYTTTPLTEDIQITGHPIIHLWITSTVKDGDFFAYLEEVDQKGLSHYITEGTLRASHRAIATPPFDYIGLPYHRSLAEDIVELPSQPVELIFDLHPTSNIFNAGHRLRITITCADKDNALTPELSPPPTVSLYRNANYASHITVPTISTG